MESVYEECLCFELGRAGLRFARQLLTPILYENKRLAAELRLDLLVEDSVVVEVKAVEQILKVHEARLLTYLRLTGKHLGLLLNFNTAHFRDGIRRKVL
jgi:GxxExxY protein